MIYGLGEFLARDGMFYICTNMRAYPETNETRRKQKYNATQSNVFLLNIKMACLIYNLIWLKLVGATLFVLLALLVQNIW